MSFLDKIWSFFSSKSNETSPVTKSNKTSEKTQKSTSGEIGSLEGTVRYFNRSRGYGFIHKAVTNDKIFVHISDLGDRIKVGDQVRFNIEKTEKGPRARQVTKQ